MTLKAGTLLKRKSDKQIYKVLEIIELSDYGKKAMSYVRFFGFYVPQKSIFKMFDLIEENK